LLALSLLGFFLSALSLYDHTSIRAGEDHFSFLCALNSAFNCQAVNLSSYSYFFGIPVASYGLFFYFACTLFYLLSLTNFSLSTEATKGVALLLSIFSLIVSAYLWLVSSLFIGFYCLNCVFLYLVNISLFFISLILPGSGVFNSLKRAVSELASGVSSLWQKGESNQLTLSLLFVLITSFILFATLPLLVRKLVVSQKDSKEAPIASFNLKNIDQDLNYFKGSPDARFELVMFSDLECPACARVHQILDSFINQNEIDAFFVFKNYPLDSACNEAIDFDYHMHACRLAQYARCAGEQGKFWQAVEAIYKSDSKNMSQTQMDEFLESLSESNKLNLSELKECLASRRHLSAIINDIKEANSLDIAGTPAVWLNGKVLNNFSPQALKAAFE
jgi:protein-disulfide isomerase/uncharacterized membrane protein